MTSYGSDYTPITQQSGDLVAQGGATLISPRSEGETAIMAGPALLREIQAGVANGDFSVSPVDPTANISDENDLPYWTYTDINSDGAITAAVVSDANAASGNVLRFTVASGTLTGKSATLTRYVPVASSASRSFSFYAEATFENGTNSTQATAKLTCEFYQSDQVTTTGTAFESDVYGFNSLQGATGITAPDLYAVAPDLTSTTAPSNAAYLKLTITIETVATQSADRVVDLTEVRLAHGLPELILTDKGDPATYQPAYILNESGDLSLVASTGENLVVGMNGYWLGSVSNTIESGGDISLIAEGDIIGTAANVDLSATTLMTLTSDATNMIAPSGVEITTDGAAAGTLTVGAVTAPAGLSLTASAGDIALRADGSDVIVQDINAANGTNPRILFRDKNNTFYAGVKSGAANVVQILNGSSATDYAQLWAERIYPMNGSTASRYMYDTGSVIGFSSGGDFNGSLNVTGSMVSDAISTTTQTASAAIWVLSSGTTYSLRRNSSSARYKTNIVDADEAVLEAARKIRPRHYESTIEDEAGATRLGFIAEEVEAAGLTHAVGYDAEGRVETLDPTALIAALFVRVNDLEQRLADLESR
jgi:hypothetical protein